MFFSPNLANNESSQYHLSKIFKAWIERDEPLQVKPSPMYLGLQAQL